MFYKVIEVHDALLRMKNIDSVLIGTRFALINIANLIRYRSVNIHSKYSEIMKLKFPP